MSELGRPPPAFAMLDAEELNDRLRVRHLNDAFRRSFSGERVVLTVMLAEEL